MYKNISIQIDRYGLMYAHIIKDYRKYNPRRSKNHKKQSLCEELRNICDR